MVIHIFAAVVIDVSAVDQCEMQCIGVRGVPVTTVTAQSIWLLQIPACHNCKEPLSHLLHAACSIHSRF